IDPAALISSSRKRMPSTAESAEEELGGDTQFSASVVTARRLHARITRPRQTTCRAATVPIAENPPCRRTQDAGGHRPIQGRRKWSGQNSAGKYPLISRPMQISTRVGVVQAIRRPP